ncbi:GntR family transcriptional regulator [Streptomyces sp. NPDC050095]|uniref:winged helix-turn-helix domain-containing protein n=1 Tax=unclassified Streptomyces TaxID=2593676 RepID=UPI00341F0E63
MDDNNGPAPRATPESMADVLRQRIRSGALKPGERLPTQAVLAEEFGVERGVVRNALQRLHSEGLLSNVKKGSPPRVAAHVPALPQASQSARSILGPRLASAFRQEDVRLDVQSLTAETLVLSLGQTLSEIYAEHLRPRSVHVRVMLPRADQRLDYPSPEKGWGHDDELDQAIDARNRWQGRSYRTILQRTLGELGKEAGIGMRVEFRSLRGTPTRKVYLLNRQEALIGYYIPGRFERVVDGYPDPVPLRDVEGTDVGMHILEASGGGLAKAMVADEQLMFDRVWEHVAQPLD